MDLIPLNENSSQAKVASGQTSVFNFLLSEPSLSFIKKKKIKLNPILNFNSSPQTQSLFKSLREAFWLVEVVLNSFNRQIQVWHAISNPVDFK